MAYLTTTDCLLDKLISALVTDTDLAEADVWYNYFANGLGVYTSQIKIPLPTECKRLVRFWIYVQVCMRNIGNNINKTQDGYEQDWYKVKYEQYLKLLDEEKANMTPNKIMGIELDNMQSNQERSNTMERA
jgi:hypothetical protein